MKPTSPPAATTPASTNANRHTVAASETLSSIAKTHYGDAKYWNQIAAANPGVNPNALKIGQVLVLPPRDSVISASASPAQPERSVSDVKPTPAAPGGVVTGGGRAPRSGEPAPAAVRLGLTPANGVDGSRANPRDREAAKLTGDETGTAPAKRDPKPDAPKADKTAEKPAEKAGGDPARARANSYVVGRGDTLITIARNVLKDETRWREIYNLNRDRLKSPNALQAGMTLKLPAERPAPRPAAARR